MARFQMFKFQISSMSKSRAESPASRRRSRSSYTFRLGYRSSVTKRLRYRSLQLRYNSRESISKCQCFDIELEVYVLWYQYLHTLITGMICFDDRSIFIEWYSRTLYQSTSSSSSTSKFKTSTVALKCTISKQGSNQSRLIFLRVYYWLLLLLLLLLPIHFLQVSGLKLMSLLSLIKLLTIIAINFIEMYYCN